MRKSLFSLLMACPLILWGQAARVDVNLLTSGPSAPGTNGLAQALWTSNSTAAICTHPSPTLAYCQSHPVATYTDSTMGIPCSSPAAQLVQLPGNTCTASTGVTSNVGFWYSGGIVDYWVTTSYGSFGPYTINPPLPSGATGIVGSGTTGQAAVYTGNGNTVGGATLGIIGGGTGATTAAGALTNLGALASYNPSYGGTMSGGYLNLGSLLSPLIFPRLTIGDNIAQSTAGSNMQNIAPTGGEVSAWWNNLTTYVPGYVAHWSGCGISGSAWSPVNNHFEPADHAYCIGYDMPFLVGTSDTHALEFWQNAIKRMEFNSTGWYVPGVAPGFGSNCLQISSTGYITNTGSSCGGGGSSPSGPSGAFLNWIGAAGTSSTLGEAPGPHSVPGLVNSNAGGGIPAANVTALTNAGNTGGWFYLPSNLQQSLGNIQIDSAVVISPTVTPYTGGPEFDGARPYADSAVTLIRQMTANTDGIDVVCNALPSCSPPIILKNVSMLGGGGTTGVGLTVTNHRSAGSYDGGFNGDHFTLKEFNVSGFSGGCAKLLGIANYQIEDFSCAMNSSVPHYGIDIGAAINNSSYIRAYGTGAGNELGFLFIERSDSLVTVDLRDVLSYGGTVLTVGNWNGTCGGTSVTPCHQVARVDAYIRDTECVVGPLGFIDSNSLAIIHWAGMAGPPCFLGPPFAGYGNVNFIAPIIMPQITPPNIGTITQSTGACTLGTATYYYQYEENNSAYMSTTAAYNTNPSAEKSTTFSAGSTNCATIPLPALMSGATSFTIYRGTAPGNEVQIATGVTGASYLDNGSGSSSTAPPIGNIPLYLALGFNANITASCSVIYQSVQAYGMMAQRETGEYFNACTPVQVEDIARIQTPTIFSRMGFYGALGSAPNGADSIFACGSKYVSSVMSHICSGNLLNAVISANLDGKISGPAQVTSTGAQGTDSKLLTSGTVSGTGVSLCTDANGGATTSGCPSNTNIGQTYNSFCIGGNTGTANYYAMYEMGQSTSTACTNAGSGATAPKIMGGSNFVGINATAGNAGNDAVNSGIVAIYDYTVSATVSGATCTIGTGTSCTWTGTAALTTGHRYGVLVHFNGAAESLANVQVGVLVQ